MLTTGMFVGSFLAIVLDNIIPGQSVIQKRIAHFTLKFNVVCKNMGVPFAIVASLTQWHSNYVPYY